MSDHAPVRLLVNPAAGRGRALHRLDSARRALARAGPFDLVTTAHAGDEARLTRDAVQDGVRTLVVLGGDGTVSRVAAALVEAQARTTLAIFGAGTGNDLARTLGAPVFDFDAMTERAYNSDPRMIDVGVADERVFVNAVGVGFDVSVLERTTRARWLRGSALYAVTALGQLFQFGGVHARIDTRRDAGTDADADAGTDARTDADTDADADAGTDAGVDGASNRDRASLPNGTRLHADVQRRWLMIVVANGQWFGGTFKIAPDASVSDGRLDLVAIGDASPLRRAQLFAGAPWGRHVTAPEVTCGQHRHVQLHFDAPPRFQADGELYQAHGRTLDISIIPKALRVVT